MGRIRPDRRIASFLRTASRNRAGAAAIEFAVIGPVLILLVTGLLMWGGWFWAAHSIQQLANDAARAAVGGLNAAERRELALAQVTRGAADLGGIRPGRLTTVVSEADGELQVDVVYDTRGVLPSFDGVPGAPDPLIRRSAHVRAGGY